MPIYEYIPDGHDCLICDGQLRVIQSISEDALTICPYCGLDIKKIVSNAQMKVKKFHGSDKAAEKGFTTFKRSEYGVWEKVSGDGPDVLIGSDEDKRAIAEEKNAPKVWDLDKPNP